MRVDLAAARKSEAFWTAQPTFMIPSSTGVMQDFRAAQLDVLRKQIQRLELAIAQLEES